MAAGAQDDSARARRLWLAARDQEAQLHSDSAMTLYRAARDADPRWLPAHLGYLLMRRERMEAADAAREYAGRAGRSPFDGCIAGYARAMAAGTAVPLLAAIRAGTLPPTSCTAYVLATLDGQSRQTYRRAAALLPDLADPWRAEARALTAAGRWAEARALLATARRTVPHAIERFQIDAALVSVTLAAGDTAGARRLERGVRAELLRDGRPGLPRWYASPWSDPIADGRRDAALARIARDWTAEWRAMRGLANDLLNRGRVNEAAVAADRLVAIADSVGPPGLRLVAYTLRGRVAAQAGRPTAAERDLRLATSVQGAGDLPYFLGEAWHNLAHAYEAQGRYALAHLAIRRFVAVVTPLTDNTIRITSLHDAGEIAWKAGWHAAARVSFSEMARVVDSLGSEFVWAAEYFERIGEIDVALAYYRRALTGLADESPEAVQALAGMTRLFERLGAFDSAEAKARRHDAARRQWPPLEVPLTPGVLARRGQPEPALALARDWASRQRSAGNIRGHTAAQLQLARLLIDRSPHAALLAARVAESLATSSRAMAELTEARRLLGMALGRTGDTAGARRALVSASALAARHPATDAVRSANVALGDLLAGARDMPGALAAYRRAAQSVETAAASLAADLDRAAYREQQLGPFDRAMSALLHSSPLDVDRLLQWSMRRKAAALALRGERERAPVGVASLARRLRPDEALLDYVVLDSVVAVMVVSRSGAAVIPLRTTATALEAAAARLTSPFTRRHAGRVDVARVTFDRGAAADLYRALIEPVTPRLRGIERLLISPDGPLALLPFELLMPRAGRYLIDDFETEYLPSASFLTPHARRARIDHAARLLAVGRVSPGSARELDTILRTWTGGSQVLREAAATEGAVRAAAPRAGIVHFAVHAYADLRDPLASHLALAADDSTDGLLHLEEIAATRIAARLVVLSACETQAGRVLRGEGAIGLARAFLSGGAEAVVATLWPVGAASADIMALFYSSLARGERPSAALAGAKRTLRGRPATAHPFYWAGFVLVSAGPSGGARHPARRRSRRPCSRAPSSPAAATPWRSGPR